MPAPSAKPPLADPTPAKPVLPHAADPPKPRTMKPSRKAPDDAPKPSQKRAPKPETPDLPKPSKKREPAGVEKNPSAPVHEKLTTHGVKPSAAFVKKRHSPKPSRKEVDPTSQLKKAVFRPRSRVATLAV